MAWSRKPVPVHLWLQQRRLAGEAERRSRTNLAVQIAIGSAVVGTMVMVLGAVAAAA